MGQPKLLLSPDEVCELIGVRRCKLFRMLKGGDIVSIKIGSLRRIPAAHLTAWVERQISQQTGLEAADVAATREGHDD